MSDVDPNEAERHLTTGAPEDHQGGEEIYRPVRRLISIDEVRRWSQLQPWIWLRDALSCWVAIGAAWSLVAWHPAWWSVAIAFPIIGNRFYGLFILGHDALHRRAFASPVWNDLLGDLFVFAPIGAITHINNRNHLNHHRQLASADDPDRHKYGCFNKATRWQLLGFLSGLTSVSRSIANVFLRVQPVAPATGAPEATPANSQYSARDILILLAWQSALCAGLTTAIGWWAYFVLWWMPVYVFTFLADNLRSFLEHSQPRPDAEADRQRLITYAAPWWECLWIAPYGMNYHAAHHLWPSVPYYHLPIADRELRSVAEPTGLEWRSSYLGYLWRYLCALPLPGCRQSSTAANA